jgi:hypothetical protein
MYIPSLARTNLYENDFNVIFPSSSCSSYWQLSGFANFIRPGLTLLMTLGEEYKS